MGWPGGLIALAAGGLITFYTTRLLAEMHEVRICVCACLYICMSIPSLKYAPVSR